MPNALMTRTPADTAVGAIEDTMAMDLSADARRREWDCRATSPMTAISMPNASSTKSPIATNADARPASMAMAIFAVPLPVNTPTFATKKLVASQTSPLVPTFADAMTALEEMVKLA